MATSEQNSQAHDHDNLDYSGYVLCMPVVAMLLQKEVALLLSLIGISALPKTPGSRCVLLTRVHNLQALLYMHCCNNSCAYGLSGLSAAESTCVSQQTSNVVGHSP